MNNNKIPLVLLAGGLGTRLRESTEYRPKPMIEIGGRPILWHIMKTFSLYDINQFIICAGYKSEQIKDYFLNYKSINYDFTVNTLTDHIRFISKNIDNWDVTVANTGELTNTGGRIHKIREYIENDIFLCTYGDGIADINIDKLIEFHKSHDKLATVTIVQQPSRFGVVQVSENNSIELFKEKPLLEGWINAGFFVFNKEFLEYLSDNIILEHEPLRRLAREGQLMAYKHSGFWQSMDTYREQLLLNELIESNKAPWIKW
jgi:glucose-1-phosphate cytidylyltransferase